jgi:hypothetical protein
VLRGDPRTGCLIAAVAAVDGEQPLSADEETFLEIQGYRQALGYVLAMRDEDYAAFDATEIRAMHYMMLGHDHTKSPGRYRKGPIFVRDEKSGRVVYEGPDAAGVPRPHGRTAGITDQTATRDLAALATEGILTAHGTGRGRFHTAGQPLRDIQERRRAQRVPLRDPYPWMRAKLGEPET